MDEYIYPTERGHEWIDQLLENWKESCKPFVSFPWLKTNVHTLVDNSARPFWLYIYYAIGKTKRASLAGRLEFRFHVSEWNRSTNFMDSETHRERQDEDGKVWFRCSVAEEIRTTSGCLLSLDDFQHPEGKKLPSAIRNSISPAIRHATIEVRRSWRHHS